MANHDAMSETNFKYDVFLSFVGEDTRDTFTCYLRDALRLKEIVTFMDDEELRVGEQIAPALLKAFKQSRISVIVFSERYATSARCLDELSEIIECQKEKKQTVIPIFYKVEPSDVRHQRNSYGEAMTKHENSFGKDSEKVSKWRSALVEVSNLKGYHLREGNESEFIQDIVSKVSIIVSPKRLRLNEHIVGMEYRVGELKSLLEMESDKTTCFLGIYGTGGIGKTTLAKVLYNSICNQFESACFLANIRETFNEFEGQKRLVESLLSDTLGKGKFRWRNVDEGTKTIKRNLDRKRVLMVLDDVDDIKQLEMLAGGRDWFGLGSRIIITTRDQHLLVDHGVGKTYEMTLLKDHESLQLFCQSAFKRNQPEPSYEELSNRAVRYANGLPLALEVIGHYLCGKDLSEWKSALDKYEESPHKGIHTILKISYDSLESNERDIFLDIACFFKGQKLEYVKTILDACSFYPDDGIKVLYDKCLIKVEDNCLRMHDLIQDMGREIVKQEAPEEVGSRSRLWFYEDVLKVLTEDTGSSKIEGVMLDPPQREKIEWIDCAFKKMKQLRILIIHNTSFSSAPSYLPTELKLLDWKSYPSPSFPPDFCPKKIVALNSRESPLIQPFQIYEHLTYMDVSYCDVIQIPNVSGAESLKELKLNKCEKLVTIDESVGFLPNLVYLSATGCPQLQSFVPRIHLPSLKFLSFNLCISLKRFPEVVREMNEALEIYLVDTCIEELPDSVGKLIGLDYLEMTGCKELQYLPSSLFILPNFVTLKVGGCSRLQESFRRLEGSHSVAEYRPNLETLHFGNADLSDVDLHVIIHTFPNLKDLNVKWNDFISVPASINESACLTSLNVSYCAKLESIPELPSCVEKVDARHCRSLSVETSSMLWSQVRKEIGRLQVIMPKTEIPEWFDYRNEGGIPGFRFRGKFPGVALAFVFNEGKDRGPLPIHWQPVGMHLLIEEAQEGQQHVHRTNYHNFMVADNHVLICDLLVVFNHVEWKCHQHDNWKTVQVVCETKLTLGSWGIYVYKKDTNMDDIQFTPTYHPRYSTVQSEEEKLRNKMQRLNIPEIYEGFLNESKVLEQREFYKNSPEFMKSTQVMLSNLRKMSMTVLAQREGKDSGFDLEDEDAKEGDSMVQWLAEIISKDNEEEKEAAGPSHVPSNVPGYNKGRHHPIIEEEGRGPGFYLEDEDVKEDDSMVEWITEHSIMQWIADTISNEKKEEEKATSPTNVPGLLMLEFNRTKRKRGESSSKTPLTTIQGTTFGASPVPSSTPTPRKASGDIQTIPSSGDFESSLIPQQSDNSHHSSLADDSTVPTSPLGPTTGPDPKDAVLVEDDVRPLDFNATDPILVEGTHPSPRILPATTNQPLPFVTISDQSATMENEFPTALLEMEEDPLALLDNTFNDKSLSVEPDPTPSNTLASLPDVEGLLQQLESFLEEDYESLGNNSTQQGRILTTCMQLESQLNLLPEEVRLVLTGCVQFFKDAFDGYSSLVHCLAIHESNVQARQRCLEQANEAKTQQTHLDIIISFGSQRLKDLDVEIRQLETKLKTLREEQGNLQTNLDAHIAERKNLENTTTELVAKARVSMFAVKASQEKFDKAKAKKTAIDNRWAKIKKVVASRTPYVSRS